MAWNKKAIPTLVGFNPVGGSIIEEIVPKAYWKNPIVVKLDIVNHPFVEEKYFKWEK